MTFLSSTINGYEGTGRSLSLKLLSQLRRQSVSDEAKGSRLRELTLQEPIRYAENDAVEAWLNELYVDPIFYRPHPSHSCASQLVSGLFEGGEPEPVGRCAKP